jgi:hypothetical protein
MEEGTYLRKREEELQRGQREQLEAAPLGGGRVSAAMRRVKAATGAARGCDIAVHR